MPRRARSIAIVFALAALSSLAANFIARNFSDGWTVDILHALSGWSDTAHMTSTADDRTMIVAIDEETYLQEPFKRTPAVAWTPQVAAVINALLDSDVKVIGLDTIFNQSLQYAGALSQDNPAAAAAFDNYDRDLLRALAKGGRQGRIVMSYTRQGGKVIQPTDAQVRAVGGLANLHPTNMDDRNNSVIRYGLLRSQDQPPLSTLPLEVFARAGDHKIGFAADGRPLVDGVPLPETTSDSLLINFRPVRQDPPIYSFADLYACAQQGKLDYFRQQFAGRTVILGTVLDLEDRHLTSKRFATNPPGGNYGPRCALEPMRDLATGHASNFIPGPYILATIIDNLKHQNWLSPASGPARLACLFMLALTTTVLIVRTRPVPASIGPAIMSLAWVGITIIAFIGNIVLPLIAGLMTIALGLFLGLTYRLTLVDRARRQIRRSFSLYLPPAEVDRLVAKEQMPALGGELRPITILFSDIASYSSLSEELAPADLVTDLNRYFGRMTEIVQRHGGFVDKYIGDGILAVFGAPLEDPAHAAAGVRAALEMIAACRDDPEMTISTHRFGIRVGVHSGEAIVGNIGSPNRFNYTVVGDSVNLASRLEGVGKRYHTAIIVSEQTRDQIDNTISFRELDRVRVVGRDQPVRLFTPLIEGDPIPYDAQDWAMALFAWRSGHFVEAAQRCTILAGRGDKIAATFAERAGEFANSPPPQWDGIVNLSEK